MISIVEFSFVNLFFVSVEKETLLLVLLLSIKVYKAKGDAI